MTGGLHVPGLPDQRARSARFCALLSSGLTSPAASVPTRQLTPQGDTARVWWPGSGPSGWLAPVTHSPPHLSSEGFQKAVRSTRC